MFLKMETFSTDSGPTVSVICRLLFYSSCVLLVCEDEKYYCDRFLGHWNVFVHVKKALLKQQQQQQQKTKKTNWTLSIVWK